MLKKKTLIIAALLAAMLLCSACITIDPSYFADIKLETEQKTAAEMFAETQELLDGSAYPDVFQKAGFVLYDIRYFSPEESEEIICLTKDCYGTNYVTNGYINLYIGNESASGSTDEGKVSYMRFLDPLETGSTEECRIGLLKSFGYGTVAAEDGDTIESIGTADGVTTVVVRNRIDQETASEYRESAAAAEGGYDYTDIIYQADAETGLIFSVECYMGKDSGESVLFCRSDVEYDAEIPEEFLNLYENTFGTGRTVEVINPQTGDTRVYEVPEGCQVFLTPGEETELFYADEELTKPVEWADESEYMLDRYYWSEGK